MQHAIVETAWGFVTIAGRRGVLLHLVLPESTPELALNRLRAEAEAGRDRLAAKPDSGFLPELQRQIRSYFDGQRIDVFSCEPGLAGLTDFRRRTLYRVAEIPYGKTMTYGDLACSLLHPAAARAVGQAVGANPIPLVIPCHRVLGKGNLGGFSATGGLDLKRRMLTLEGHQS
ncbi:MAG: methylated-DNA--[protein]-cysteine S-methyltransferase [Solirubrobacterales bacterium]